MRKKGNGSEQTVDVETISLLVKTTLTGRDLFECPLSISQYLPTPQSPFLSKANLLIFQRENKGIRLCIFSNRTSTFQLCVSFQFYKKNIYSVLNRLINCFAIMCFLLFVFVVTAVSRCWYKMRENIQHRLFRGEKIYF